MELMESLREDPRLVDLEVKQKTLDVQKKKRRSGFGHIEDRVWRKDSASEGGSRNEHSGRARGGSRQIGRCSSYAVTVNVKIAWDMEMWNFDVLNFWFCYDLLINVWDP